jgi:predicted protein tyrosine phosphatase
VVVYVCSLEEMPRHVQRLRPSHLVSLVAPEEQPPTPPGIAGSRHLRLGVDDISEPLAQCTLPDEDHVRLLIGFLREWHDTCRRTGPILIHCLAGISRSTAAALVALALDAHGREEIAARQLRQAAPHASPNRRIVALADRLLGRGGRLIAARDAMGPAEPLLAGPLVELPLEARDAAAPTPVY